MVKVDDDWISDFRRKATPGTLSAEVQSQSMAAVWLKEAEAPATYSFHIRND